MVALAEEERVTGAVGDVRQANEAVKKEDAVPGQSGIIRRTAKSTRPFAAVAAITAHPIETPGPRRGARCRELPHGLRQRIRGAEQDLDDLGLGGIPSRDVVEVIVAVPLLVQVVLFDVGEQLDPQGGAPGRTIADKDRKARPGGELAVV